jgi:hypothetical protein
LIMAIEKRTGEFLREMSKRFWESTPSIGNSGKIWTKTSEIWKMAKKILR